MSFKNYNIILIVFLSLALIPLISASFQTDGGGYTLVIGGKSSSIIQTNNDSNALIIAPQEESSFYSSGEGNILIIGTYFTERKAGAAVNSPPTIPTLSSPSNDSSTTTRQPNFTWDPSTDPDSDPIYYDILIDDSIDFTSPIRSDNKTTTSFSPTSTLNVDTIYYWKVRSNDQKDGGLSGFSPMWVITIDSYVSISINGTAKISFGSKLPGESDNTTDDNPPPLLIQNNGNSFVNITVNATNSLWSSQGLNTQYFRYKAGVNESGSFSVSQSSWANMLSTAALFVDMLNYINETDNARYEALITVPPDETPGDKGAGILFTASLGDHAS